MKALCSSNLTFWSLAHPWSSCLWNWIVRAVSSRAYSAGYSHPSLWAVAAVTMESCHRISFVQRNLFGNSLSDYRRLSNVGRSAFHPRQIPLTCCLWVPDRLFSWPHSHRQGYCWKMRHLRNRVAWRTKLWFVSIVTRWVAGPQVFQRNDRASWREGWWRRRILFRSQGLQRATLGCQENWESSRRNEQTNLFLVR